MGMMVSTFSGPRPDEPEPPSGQLTLRAPPPIEPDEGMGGLLVTAVPMLGGLGSVALIATMDRAGGRSIIAAGTFLAATLGFVVLQLDRQRRQRALRSARTRTAYLRHLAEARALIRDAADRQRQARIWHHPHPTSLPALAAERSRVWERSSAHPDFLRVRYGVHAEPLTLDVAPPEVAVEEADPVAATALRRFLAAHRLVSRVPASIDLRAISRVELAGTEESARSLARALVCSATAFHAPEHLAVAVVKSSGVVYDG